jgi:putative transposase
MRLKLVEMEVMPDHVHLLLADVDPQFGIHRVVKAIKGRSSRFLRQEFPALRARIPTLWTNSYPSVPVHLKFLVFTLMPSIC